MPGLIPVGNPAVVNLETAAKIAEAIDEKKPCITKNLTVRGKINGGNEAHVFMDVPVGVSVLALIFLKLHVVLNLSRTISRP